MVFNDFHVTRATDPEANAGVSPIVDASEAIIEVNSNATR